MIGIMTRIEFESLLGSFNIQDHSFKDPPKEVMEKVQGAWIQGKFDCIRLDKTVVS